MNMSFYSAAVGAIEQQKRQNVTANNIANVNTFGFRAGVPAFGELMNRAITGIDDERVAEGTGARLIQTSKDFRCAGYRETGLDLDFAIVGEGFFALYDMESEEVSFTRDGAFSMRRFEVAADENAEGGETVEVWRLTDNSLLNTSPSPRDHSNSRMPSSA